MADCKVPKSCASKINQSPYKSITTVDSLHEVIFLEEPLCGIVLTCFLDRRHFLQEALPHRARFSNPW